MTTIERAPAVRGCVGRLEPDGTIVEILIDPLDRCAVDPGTSFLDLLDEGSRGKGVLFLEHLRHHGVALGWELRLTGEDDTLLRFSGAREARTLLLLGSPGSEDLDAALGAITTVNNTVLNRLRELERAHANARVEPAGPAVSDYASLNRELVDLHRELARRTAQLEEVNEQKNQLIGMAAHDLRNPIGAIRGFAQLLLSRVGDRLDGRERMVLERIERSSDHMLDLVTDLLELTEVDRTGLAITLDRATCDVAELVTQSVEVDRALAEEKEITIELMLADAPLVAVLDERKLEQVLANLLSNAIKFSAPGTTIRVHLRGEGRALVLEVADQGPGIPEDEREEVFRPFARTSVRPTAGERSTGLGMAIVQRIVEGHGGRIELESELGVGSTFRLWLPCTPDDVLPSAAPRG
jgi:two-component system, OmpR family, sensor kinase